MSNAQNLNYGIIGNCKSAALIDKNASIDGVVSQDLIHPLFLQKY